MFKKIAILSLFAFVGIVKASAQEKHHHGDWHTDSTQKGAFGRPQFEDGPHKGKMGYSNGIKLEMVIPSNSKKVDVSYFLYDTLNKATDAKAYTGTVKYVFGGANEFLETKLAFGKESNQYVATMEGWQEYKRAIVTIKSGEKTCVFYFPNLIKPHPKGMQGGHHGGGAH